MNLLFTRNWLVILILMLPFGANSSLRDDLLPFPSKPPAPEFETHTFRGEPVSKASLKGKVVLVNFWATWCPPCREEMPSMMEAAKRLADDSFVIVAINLGEEEFVIENFNDEFDITGHMTVLMDTDNSTIGLWNVRGLPTSFILDKQGRIVYMARGPRQFDSSPILELLQALIDE